MEIAILEGQVTVDGAIKKIENIVNGRKDSDIGDPEIRKFEDIKDYYLRAKTAPDIDLLVEADLSDKNVQEQLGIGGKFNPDDPNLPQKVKDRIAEVRNEGKEVQYFYDETTGKIYINENADTNTVKAGIAREWAIREQLENGEGLENEEGQRKATVAGEIAYDEVMKRTKDQDSSDVFSGIEYGQLDEDSEITGDKVFLTLEKGNLVKTFDDLIKNNEYDLTRFQKMSSVERQHILKGLQKITKDKLDIGKDENGNEIIIITIC